MFLFNQADNDSELFQLTFQTELQPEALWDFNYRLFIKVALREAKTNNNFINYSYSIYPKCQMVLGSTANTKLSLGEWSLVFEISATSYNFKVRLVIKMIRTVEQNTLLLPNKGNKYNFEEVGKADKTEVMQNASKMPSQICVPRYLQTKQESCWYWGDSKVGVKEQPPKILGHQILKTTEKDSQKTK